MKLDRNTNPNGTGKYALLKMRQLVTLGHSGALPKEVLTAIETLEKHDLIHYGNEQPNGVEQFFVVKYKDQFAGNALRAYAGAVASEAECCEATEPDKARELREYADEIYKEAALAVVVGRRIPD